MIPLGRAVDMLVRRGYPFARAREVAFAYRWLRGVGRTAADAFALAVRT